MKSDIAITHGPIFRPQGRIAGAIFANFGRKAGDLGPKLKNLTHLVLHRRPVRANPLHDFHKIRSILANIRSNLMRLGL